jgi:hypothetical protein
MHPRQMRETVNPVFPSFAYCMPILSGPRPSAHVPFVHQSIAVVQCCSRTFPPHHRFVKLDAAAVAPGGWFARAGAIMPPCIHSILMEQFDEAAR